LTTKLHALCDALGNPIRLFLTPGNVADCAQAEDLLKDIDADNALADKGYGSDTIVEIITANEANAVIPPKSNRLVQRLRDLRFIASAISSSASSPRSSTIAPSQPDMPSAAKIIWRSSIWFAKLYGLNDCQQKLGVPAKLG
jgi:transposase